MEPAKSNQFNKNVVMLYTQEPDFTGYKSLEYSAISALEAKTSGIFNIVKELSFCS